MLSALLACAAMAGEPPPPAQAPTDAAQHMEQINDNLDAALERLRQMAKEAPPPPAEPPSDVPPSTGTYAVVTVEAPPPPTSLNAPPKPTPPAE